MVLAFIVITAGSFVRLSDAGLGCPDWPGCYGQALIADSAEFHTHAAEQFPGQIPDLAKAWKEMGHRYLAGALGFLIVLLVLLSPGQTQCRKAAVWTSLALLLMLGLQAALGMWAVKLGTMPIVVTAHLLLGLTTFWILFWLFLRVGQGIRPMSERLGPIGFARFGMLVLVIQIFLGGWTSTNYAALACSDLPLCQNQWWPDADYAYALNFWQGLFSGHDPGMAQQAKVAVHWLHRVGALFTLILLTSTALLALSAQRVKPVKMAGIGLIVLLISQISLGFAIVRFSLPLGLAVSHSALAALLMLPLIAIGFYSRYGCIDIKESSLPIEAEVKIPAPAPAPSGQREAEAYIPAPPETLYLRLKSQLQRTRGGFTNVFANLGIGQKEIDHDVLEQIETSLLMADIGLDATTGIIGRLTQNLERHQLQDPATLSSALKQELLAILQPCSLPLTIEKSDRPFVILVVGVNGAGKTTTIGKLAKRLQAQGLSVMLAAGDTFRAAAVEQLQTWGERNRIHVVAQHTGADSASVIYDGLQSAKAKGVDVLIADTAGRLHTKSNLMDELKKVKRIMAKLDETAPHEVLLVLDAGTGQNALSQARLFNEAVALNGIVLTKLDGTAKGGVIFALAKQMAIPIRYIGVGEGIDDLQDFNAEHFVDALFAKD